MLRHFVFKIYAFEGKLSRYWSVRPGISFSVSLFFFLIFTVILHKHRYEVVKNFMYIMSHICCMYVNRKQRVAYINTLKRSLVAQILMNRPPQKRSLSQITIFFNIPPTFVLVFLKTKWDFFTFYWLPIVHKQPYKADLFLIPAHARLPNYQNC